MCAVDCKSLGQAGAALDTLSPVSRDASIEHPLCAQQVERKSFQNVLANALFFFFF